MIAFSLVYVSALLLLAYASRPLLGTLSSPLERVPLIPCVDGPVLELLDGPEEDRPRGQTLCRLY